MSGPGCLMTGRYFSGYKCLQEGRGPAEIPGGVDSILDQMVRRDIYSEVQNGKLDELTKSVNLMLGEIFAGNRSVSD
jgi:hypothetical protein